MHKSECNESIFVAEVERRFTFVAPVPEQEENAITVREAAKKMALLMARVCPDSREFRTALDKLEEVVFWANAGIIRY